LICNQFKLSTKQILDPNHELSKAFVNLFKKPTQEEVKMYLEMAINVKRLFINLAKIREITIKTPVNANNPLSSIFCTCPDYFRASFCLHTLTLLIKEEYISVDLPKVNQRGRKAKISFHWDETNEAENEQPQEDDEL
jgi:hypothetical protein